MTKVIYGFVIFLVAANLAALNFFLVKNNQKVFDLETKITEISLEPNKIETRVIEKTNTIISTPAAVSTIKPVIPTPTKAVAREFIIPLGSATVTKEGEWVEQYGVQMRIDTANYPNIKAAYFEVVMHIPNAQGQMKAGLVDYGEELVTTSGIGELLSVPIFLRGGNNVYRVKLFNSIGTGVLDFARIRIVTKIGRAHV